jgi:hypothetical protein
MDLVATVMVTKKGGGGHVNVSRLNGQRVFGASFETEAEDDGDGDGDGEGVLRNSEDREAEQGNEAGVEGFVRAVTWRRDGEFGFYFHFWFLFSFPFWPGTWRWSDIIANVQCIARTNPRSCVCRWHSVLDQCVHGQNCPSTIYPPSPAGIDGHRR